MKLTPAQVAQFYDQGYLIVENVLSESEIEPIREEYNAILDREAPRLVAKGQLSQTYDHLPFEERYTAMLNEIDDMYALYQYLDISLPLQAQIPADTEMNAGPAVFHNILRNKNILDIAESLLGPELYSNPVQHARIKPPKSALPQTIALDSNVARTFWHQDEAVLTDDALDINMVTVWVAMTDATVENGCLICVPRSHRQDATMHCPANGSSAAEIFIPDELIDSARIDGASEWRIYAQIILPLARPALAVLAIFSIMWRWNDFLWPFIVLSESRLFTLQVGLQTFQGELDIQWHLILAMTVLTILPITLVFAFLQKYITSGIATTGLK